MDDIAQAKKDSGVCGTNVRGRRRGVSTTL